MSSIVEICNRGLDKVGHGPINALGDGSKASNLCDRMWPIVRDQLLREHPWNFAVKRATLAPSSTAPDWGFLYKHQMPVDLLKLTDVLDLSTGEYQVEGRFILANTDVLYIRFISKVEDPNLYDSLFIELAATLIAFNAAEPLTQSNTKKEALWSEYMDALNKAKRSDGLENPPTKYEEDDWLTVRY